LEFIIWLFKYLLTGQYSFPVWIAIELYQNWSAMHCKCQLISTWIYVYQFLQGTFTLLPNRCCISWTQIALADEI